MLIIFFLLGLIVGSFLNVVISRLPQAESLLGRSHCPHCKKKIRWYDNIPLLSFVLLGTRCRDCKEKISAVYPLVEGATGIIFALVGAYFFRPESFSTWPETAFYLAVFSLLIVIFVYDLKHMEIPMIIVWLGVGISVAYLLFADWVSFKPALGIMASGTFSGLLAGLAAFIFFFALSAGSREKWMGMGDAYLALLAGLITLWPAIIGALLFAFMAGAFYGIILIVTGKKTLKSQVPFAPFLVAGTMVAVMLPKIFPAVKFWAFYI
jgi:leader peptidase (prepilin peptidase)/N-methyltransferase